MMNELDHEVPRSVNCDAKNRVYQCISTWNSIISILMNLPDHEMPLGCESV